MTPEQLRTFRIMLELTTRQAAEHYGVAWRTWQAYEAGTRRIPEHIADAVRQAVRKAAPAIRELLQEVEGAGAG